MLGRWYLSKGLKKVREEIFGGKSSPDRGSNKGKLSRVHLVCSGVSSRKGSYRGHRPIEGNKAVWPCGLWFV